MTDYGKLKVKELQDILKGLKLAHTGTKSELISRLEEEDSKTAAAEDPDPVEDPETIVTETVEKAETGKVSETVAETPAGTVVETVVETATPAVPEPTDEELFAQASGDLQQQISRAKRFGGDAAELEARLARLSKFGVGALREARAQALREAAKMNRQQIPGRVGKNSSRRNRNRKKQAA